MLKKIFIVLTVILVSSLSSATLSGVGVGFSYIGTPNNTIDGERVNDASNGFGTYISADYFKRKSIFATAIFENDFRSTKSSSKDKYKNNNDADIYTKLNVIISNLTFALGAGVRFSSENVFDESRGMKFLFLMYTGIEYDIAPIALGVDYKLAPYNDNFEQNVRIYIKRLFMKKQAYLTLGYLYRERSRKSSSEDKNNSVFLGLGIKFK